MHTVEDDDVGRANVGGDFVESRFNALGFGDVDGEGVESFWHVVAFGVTRSESNFVVLLEQDLGDGVADVGPSANDESNKFRGHIRESKVGWDDG